MTEYRPGKLTEETEVTEVTEGKKANAVKRSTLSAFELARMLKGDHPQVEDPTALRPIVQRWHRTYEITEPFDAYFSVFAYCWRLVLFPYGRKPLEEAQDLMKATPEPPEAIVFPEDYKRKLVHLCWSLQQVRGPSPFPLGCRAAARVIGVSHTAASLALADLINAGILELDTPGTKGDSSKNRKAARYRYVHYVPEIGREA
ncbi:MAG: hypothetical protein ACYS7M_00085 [Planctomycetota bacterium]|jgi:hypothetical protein